MTGRRAVFFDRDGVLNEVVWRAGEAGSPRAVEELRIEPGARRALEALRAEGFRVFVITNQPDIARGHVRPAVAAAIAAEVAAALPLDDAEMCPHDDADGCACRKPLPGMIHQLAARWSVDAASSYVVGDRWRDIGAGRAAGCRTVLLSRPYNEGVVADLVVNSLEEAVSTVLRESSATSSAAGRRA